MASKCSKDYVSRQGYVDQPMVLKHDQRAQAKFRLHGRNTDDVHNDEAVCNVWNSILYLAGQRASLPLRHGSWGGVPAVSHPQKA